MSQWTQVLLAIIISIAAGASLTAMLFYLLIFPLINKIFNKSFPCYDFYKNADDWMDGYFHQTMVKLEVEKAIMPRNSPKINEVEEKKPVRFVDVHKDVETVRLPKVVAAPERDEKLTVSKIDVAAKDIAKLPGSAPTINVARNDKNVRPVRPLQTPKVKETTVPNASKPPIKPTAKDDAVKTFELNIPSVAPQMDIKNTSQGKTAPTRASNVKKGAAVQKRADSTVETIEIPTPPPSGDKK